MNGKTERFWSTPKGMGAIGLIAAVSYFLLTEHYAHLIHALPILVLLACPLMHVFMHGHHGGHGRGHEQQSDDR